MELLKTLSSYSWDTKAVIVSAAFAINYGEFWLVEQLQTTNPLAKNIAALKDVPSIIEHAGDLKKRFEVVLNFLNQVLQVTHCIIMLKELRVHQPYMTSTAESWEIMNLAHKLLVIFEHLQNQLRKCIETMNKKKVEDASFAFRKLMESAHIDNMKLIDKNLVEKQEQIEALHLKYVLLLISNLELPQEELHIVHSIYNQHPMRHEYEVIWMPLVDPTAPLTPQETVFYDLRNNMPWHSVDHPSLVEPLAARYFRDVWGFMHTPMMVVLDPQGKPAN
ncbi:Protein SIEVE ELEMENT OCCLUSION B [Striga hermonthica]|uniref:Protein SIEVE ELEMENT OCCLUSION B n=1 Tax=Striga hermonthica TaxID=68872 RepID=A0A9N7NL74_STRHE|nr:Protein SIEVE ELEMENT OCCLUSION B [Striga hermonthica]